MHETTTVVRLPVLFNGGKRARVLAWRTPYPDGSGLALGDYGVHGLGRAIQRQRPRSGVHGFAVHKRQLADALHTRTAARLFWSARGDYGRPTTTVARSLLCRVRDEGHGRVLQTVNRVAIDHGRVDRRMAVHRLHLLHARCCLSRWLFLWSTPQRL